MTSLFLISENTTKVVPEGEELRDVDREELVKKYIMYGLEPLKVEADDDKVIVYFLASETSGFENMYFSNKEVVIPLQRVTYANEYWRDLIVLWRSKKRRTKSS